MIRSQHSSRLIGREAVRTKKDGFTRVPTGGLCGAESVRSVDDSMERVTTERCYFRTRHAGHSRYDVCIAWLPLLDGWSIPGNTTLPESA